MKSLFYFIFGCSFLIACNNQSENELILNYFEAFNQSDFDELSKLVTPDFKMTEGSFSLCCSKEEFKTIFQWDSVFVPHYKVLSVNKQEAGSDAVISKTDRRIAFLHDDPMISNISVEFKNGKISQLIIKDYQQFDTKKWSGRLNDIISWININSPEINGFQKDITPEGAHHYLKAIDLFSHRELEHNENIFIDNDLQLVHLKDSVFIHVSWYNSEKYGRFASNGMIVAKQGKALLVDTPMDNEQTQRLYNFLKDRMNIEVTMFIPGHFHEDCMGGISFLHSKEVRSIANSLTIQKCRELGLEAPQNSFESNKVIDFNGESIECSYDGGGHSFDNITVWLPNQKILFGGCMVKNKNSKGLGNLSDAIVDEWDGTVRKLLNKYGNAEYVIPGHGAYGGVGLLNHTIDLVKDYKSRNY